jgi:hypothetical protein
MPDIAPAQSIKSFVHDCLERHDVRRRSATLVRWALGVLIAVNILAFVLGTVPTLRTHHQALFDALLHGSMAVFTRRVCTPIRCVGVCVSCCRR